MPIIDKNESTFRPSFLMRNSHLQTILPTLYRKVEDVIYSRERIITADDDFIDIDYLKGHSKSAIIICHGLEGSSSRAYMKGMARVFSENNIDPFCFNFRSCSGEMNRLARMYSAGGTDDLEIVIDHVLSLGQYDRIFLVGFSLGGNLILKYLGDRAGEVHSSIGGAVAVSAAVDLKSTCMEMIKIKNFIYHKRFVKMLMKKFEKKLQVHDELKKIDISSIKTIIDFDEHVTAPLLGFRDALDYWESSSSIGKLKDISVPTLLISAMDDSILGKECYPFDIAEKNSMLFLETPKHGGHVGFVNKIGERAYWHENRALEFLKQIQYEV